jgi:hypothetical protein
MQSPNTLVRTVEQSTRLIGDQMSKMRMWLDNRKI